jgi:hypothetical protein
LNLDRVWITADGRARLLDFPVPGTVSCERGQPPPPETDSLTPAAFLRQVADAALEGRSARPTGDRACPLARVPVALHARQLLETLKTDNNLQTSIANLRPLLDFPAQVTRARRAVLLAGALAIPLLTTLVGGGLYVVRAVVQKHQPELATLLECLAHHQQLVREVRSGQADKVPLRDAFEIYVAGRFGPVITNAAVWNRVLTQITVFEPLRSNAEAILARTPPPTPGQFEEATAEVTAFFKKSPDEAARGSMEQIPLPVAAMLVGYGNGVIFVVVPCLVASLLFRGGALVRLLGIAYVNRRGELASRGRVAARAVVAWLPFLLLPFAVRGLTPLLDSTGALILVLGTAAGLALSSVLLPIRGLADRLAGTWLVPR